MIIKLRTSQKVTAGLHGGRERERKRGKKRDKGKGGGEGRGSWRERKERQKDEDESVGEMMGIKREMGQDNPGQS